MNKKFFALLALIFTGLFITSCSKSDDTESIENYVNDAVISLETRGGLGRGGCFEIIFPQSITLPDGTSVEVDSYAQLRDMIRRWIKINGKPNVRPLFAIDWEYPMSVINADGETVTINSREELIQLKKECIQDASGQGKPCFKINFPVSISYPNGSITEYATPAELKIALKEWKKGNPSSTDRPYLVFPISITMEDGTIVNVNSREELREIKKNCR